MNAVAGEIQLKWADNSKRESHPSELHIGELLCYSSQNTIKQRNDMCAESRLRTTLVSAMSDQNLRCSLYG